MKTLVIGGTGFVGSHIARALVEGGVNVCVAGRKDPQAHGAGGTGQDGIEYRYGDVLDPGSLRECISGVDVVFSTFGLLGEWGVPDRVYWDINTRGVENVVERCGDAEVKQLIHISSAGVLGPLPDGVVADESFAFNPSNVYERTKSEGEKAVLRISRDKDLPFTIIRPEFVYGPGDMHVLGLFRAVRDRRFVILGSGNSLLHPTYIEDLIRGICLCVNNGKAMGKTFLMPGSVPISVGTITKIVSEELKVRLPAIRVPLRAAKLAAVLFELSAAVSRNANPLLTRSRVKFFTENRAFSFRKAREELGYIPTVDFREGVRRTIDWYRENGFL
jgi:dihydroflavonol-4-reductase